MSLFSLRFCWLWLALAAILANSGPAVAAKRVALVVGNSAYKHTGELTNPRNDAADLATTFKKLGFQVLEGIDLDKTAFDRKVREFAISLQGADIGVFFYAGHGLQVGGQNYLVPVDAELLTAAALDFEMVRLDLLHRTMEREVPTNVVFLDACRNNPLERNLKRAMGTRSVEIGRGLAPVESGIGTLISFSTQPGNVAADGTGRNSPFAAALVRHLSTSNDDLSATLISVRNDVMKETQRRQVPWEHSALTGRLYLGAAPQATVPIVSQLPTSEAERAWALTKDTTNQVVLDAFTVRFKDTFYADLARARIEELRQQAPPKSPEMAPTSQETPRKQTAATQPESAQAEIGEAERLWAITKDQTDIAPFFAFTMGQFRDTAFADLARSRVDKLMGQQIAAISGFKVDKHAFIYGHIIDTARTSTLTACGKRCLQEPQCIAIDWDSTRKCRLFRKINETHRTEAAWGSFAGMRQ